MKDNILEIQNLKVIFPHGNGNCAGSRGHQP